VLALCALFDPTQSVWPLVGLALALATLSATQDVAIDAFRTEALTPAARGLGTGYSVAAYRLAMFASGAGALMLADRWGFRVTYLWMAGLMLVGCLVSLIAREPAIPETLRPANREESGLAAPLRQLLGRSHLLPLLLFVVLYKLGDQFAGALAQTFFIRGQGFSLTEIGAIYKGVGIVAALAGGILGGALMLRMSLWRALMVFGALQALTNIGFLVLALGSKSLTGMMLVVMLENFCGGMGTCAHVALIMALCDARYTATQFALLSALASVGRVVLGPIAGLVAGWGWPVFFAVSCGLALPALLLLWSIRPTVEAALPESQP
jgi:PAT family beta-lactamase induction signal transducer AmpG